MLETTNQLQSRRIELTEEKMTKENNCTCKYHSSVILLLQNLASYNGEVTAAEPAESILAVLNCDSHGKAEKELANQFKDKGHNPLFALGTSKAFHEGKFTWPSNDQPINFSPFAVMEVPTDGISMNTWDVYISRTELNGEKMSTKKIKKWLKQAIKVPGTYHEMIEQANIYVSGLEILGGDECNCVFKVKAFVKVMKTFKKKSRPRSQEIKILHLLFYFKLAFGSTTTLWYASEPKTLTMSPRSS